METEKLEGISQDEGKVIVDLQDRGATVTVTVLAELLPGVERKVKYTKQHIIAKWPSGRKWCVKVEEKDKVYLVNKDKWRKGVGSEVANEEARKQVTGTSPLLSGEVEAEKITHSPKKRRGRKPRLPGTLPRTVEGVAEAKKILRQYASRGNLSDGEKGILTNIGGVRARHMDGETRDRIINLFDRVTGRLGE